MVKLDIEIFVIAIAIFIFVVFTVGLIVLFIDNEKSFSSDVRQKLMYSGMGLLGGGFLLILATVAFFVSRSVKVW